jgi:uncharacterized protein YukE
LIDNRHRQLRQQGNQVKKNLEKIANSIRNQQKSMSDNEAGEGGEKLIYGWNHHALI